MKQSEKLDLILKGLYDYKDTGKYHSLIGVCNAINIPLALEEWNRLAHRLKDDGYVRTIFNYDDCMLQLTTYGIDYCEQDSYTYSGNAIITNTYNINVENSSNINIVSQSTDVKITLETKNEADKKIELLLKKLSELTEIDNDLKTDIFDCVKDIQNKLRQNEKVPKYSLKGLIDLTSKVASLSSLGVGIAQLFGA